LWDFCSLAHEIPGIATDFADGSGPMGGLVADANGALYGTANSGGYVSDTTPPSALAGVVFQLSPPANASGKWNFTPLHTFVNQGQDGAYPQATLVFDKLGQLYGTTIEGGVGIGAGTVFQLKPSSITGGGWSENILYSFSGADGYYPRGARLLLKGNFIYGATMWGGVANFGTVFRLPKP
jgi:hypothetical protein